MKLSLRFIIPLFLALCLIAYGLLPVFDNLTRRWFTRDIETRSRVIASAITESVANVVDQDSAREQIMKLFRRATVDERLLAIGYCDQSGALKYQSEHFPRDYKCPGIGIPEEGSFETRKWIGGDIHVATFPVESSVGRKGDLILVHDLSFIERRSRDTREYFFYFFLILGLVISLISSLIAQLIWRGWNRTIRSIISGEALLTPRRILDAPEMKPILRDLRKVIRNVEKSRKERDEEQVTWNPAALRDLLNRELAGEEIIVVSNREPYIHVKRGEKIDVQIPASGLVTALEPVMRACSGTWIAHGSGSADREVVDRHDRVMVPPDEPAYALRRVWLSREEEDGYYYGFANEGLWPLCHIAYTRPTFRSSDWDQYVKVNQKFADVVAAESKTKDPVVLVQDYHFALLPKMIRDRLPRSTIITFWHIPWPNAETFGICPWREEIIEGLLGSSIMGFHTQYHCNNFIETVDRYMECRIDKESSTISYAGKLTAVSPYPISIEWPPRWMKFPLPIEQCREKVYREHKIKPDILIGVGVDRLDYTKGIVERFRAVERLLEMYPEWVGRYTFLQIAAPSRSTITSYRMLYHEVINEVERINSRFESEGYQPLCLVAEHHEPAAVYEIYRAAQHCCVSSLHDGMNLVAKEFVASRDDEQGVLLLSSFTGAARELPEALIFNPYSVDECAEAMNTALRMSPMEQKERIRSMRGLIQEFNVYRWAGRMLIDAGRIRRRERLAVRFGKHRLEARASI